MKNIVNRLVLAGASGVLAVVSAYLIIPFEGEVVNKNGNHVVYKDIVGINTACWGQTGADLDGRKLSAGVTYTQEYCEKWYLKELMEYNKAMKKRVKVELKPHEEAAYTSFVWNVGLGAWNSSTLLKKLNAGDREGACKQILVWNKATFDKKGADRQRASGETCTAKSNQPGKYSCTVKGLTNRRVAEYQVCTNNNADVTKVLEEVKLLETDEGVVESISPEDVPLDSKPLEGLSSPPPTSPLPIEGLDVSSPILEPTSVLPCKWQLFGKCLWRGKGV